MGRQKGTPENSNVLWKGGKAHCYRKHYTALKTNELQPQATGVNVKDILQKGGPVGVRCRQIHTRGVGGLKTVKKLTGV